MRNYVSIVKIWDFAEQGKEDTNVTEYIKTLSIEFQLELLVWTHDEFYFNLHNKYIK